MAGEEVVARGDPPDHVGGHQTLGEWSLWVFYAGAVVTLYGTIFASTAAHSRLFADLARLLGIYRREDAVRRRQWRQAAVVMLSVVPVGFYWLFESPVQMVVAGGVAQALMLPIIGVAALYLRRVHVPADIHGTRAGGLMLWFSTSVMGTVALYYLWSRVA